MDFSQSNWWKYMDESMRDLVKQSFSLLEHEHQDPTHTAQHDYSFIVFPMAKAYEGFLKKLFLDLKLINKSQFFGDRFRIGRGLNPRLPRRYQSDWVFGKLLTYCGNQDLPLRLWETWKLARNRIFHFFPDHHEFITLPRAQELLALISETMSAALVGCKLTNR